MSELKPCPFCGGEARTRLDGKWWVACAGCTCEIGFEGMDENGLWGHYDTEAEAIDAWNTRAAERTCRIEKRGDEWYCSCCGEMVGCDDPWSELFINGNAVELWNRCPNCGAKVVGEWASAIIPVRR